LKLYFNFNLGEGLKNILESLEKFFKGDPHFKHWVAYDKDIPFGYLLTSEIPKGSPEDEYAPFCKEKGKAITLDLFICDLNYLGKGLSVAMIQEFLLTQFPDVTEVFIDPEASNTRAVHVYEKAGFQIIDEFIASATLQDRNNSCFWIPTTVIR